MKLVLDPKILFIRAQEMPLHFKMSSYKYLLTSSNTFVPFRPLHSVLIIYSISILFLFIQFPYIERIQNTKCQTENRKLKKQIFRGRNQETEKNLLFPLPLTLRQQTRLNKFSQIKILLLG